MRYSESEEKTILDNLFEKKYQCQSDRFSLSFLNKSTNADDLFIKKTITWGNGDLNKGVVRTETNEDELLLAMFHNQARNEVGLDYMRTMNHSDKDYVNLTVAEIAELIQNSGSVSLIDVLSCVEIYTNICSYIKLVDDKKAYEVHYTPPPEKDMLAFMSVRGMVEQLAVRYIQLGKGDNIMSILNSLFAPTATATFNTERQKLKMDGKSKTIVIESGQLNYRSLMQSGN